MKYVVTRYFDYIAENINVFDNKEEAKKYLEYMKKCSLEWDEREEG